MTLRELLSILNKLKKCHPETKDALMVAVNREGQQFHLNYIGFDIKHKPAKIKLEE